ncbi:M23 family metallopeptidase [Polynucleobacter corsicus]|uniref:M23 family metallopeptidase n=1 Tax=Polynucleobacter corsicus TaxID=2081042 RepID=UPI001BFDC477|nr:M23 family metallopeptidase [Polynucleobacter corsicus]QWE17829.1 M23 family metallopeptidase [Polynucleobacter corsicus]
MQIFWVSGAVGKIHRINLTLKHLLLGACAFALTLILLGVFLQYMGFQMAIEYNPQLARKLGNVHTAVELENLNIFYRQKLIAIEKQVASYQLKINDLQTSNQKLSVLATPPVIQKDKPRQASVGGPFISPTRSESNPSLMNALQDSLQDMKRNNEHLNKLSEHWIGYVSWLETIPTGMPLQDRISISSGYGKRLDPFKNIWSEHLGVDFQAPLGTAIVSSGFGRVSKALRDPVYGNLLVIDHRAGIQTRYAHASELLVTEGQEVRRGQLIARVGSTGRATGPHLHYEVLKDSKLIDPAQILIGQFASQ